jgi:hypothetical protein
MQSPTTKLRKKIDTQTQDPIVTFDHLTSCYPRQENDDDNSSAAHGFPSSSEENLYETGMLVKIFLKC